MSKMDAVRAMREARFAEAQARAGKPTKPGARPAAAAGPRRTAKPAATPEPAPEPAAVTDELCGHRNMSGRTCTRERGHAAKSHRYS
ncbi:MAG TPA: hypothetical protein VM575_06555 [Nocardioides sp.]|nr:hypothetical protein [Nocardioides sp.]